MCGLTLKFTAHARQRGFTLLEVLIAVIVLSLGLLGLAKLQTVGLTANNIAYLRSQATILAYEAMDMIQADRNNAQAGCYDVDRKTSGSSCGDPAATSIEGWKNRLKDILPEGEGAITVREDELHHVVTVEIWMLGYDQEAGWVGDDEPFVKVSSGI